MTRQERERRETNRIFKKRKIGEKVRTDREEYVYVYMWTEMDPVETQKAERKTEKSDILELYAVYFETWQYTSLQYFPKYPV